MPSTESIFVEAELVECSCPEEHEPGSVTYHIDRMPSAVGEMIRASAVGPRRLEYDLVVRQQPELAADGWTRVAWEDEDGRVMTVRLRLYTPKLAAPAMET